MKKILVIDPIAEDPWYESDRIFYSEHSQKDMKVDVVRIDYGPKTSMGSGLIGLIDQIFVVKKAMWAEQQGYSAVIVNCFADPGVMAARTMVRIPVVGPGEATLHVASMLGRRISILSPGDPSSYSKPGESRVFDNLRFEIASNRHVGPITDLQKDFEKTYKIILEKARQCVEEDGAQVIVFGCTVMSFDRLAERLQKELGIPVLDASSTALVVAELLVNKNVTHSLKAYPKPREVEVLLPIDPKLILE